MPDKIELDSESVLNRDLFLQFLEQRASEAEVVEPEVSKGSSSADIVTQRLIERFEKRSHASDTAAEVEVIEQEILDRSADHALNGLVKRFADMRSAPRNFK